MNINVQQAAPRYLATIFAASIPFFVLDAIHGPKDVTPAWLLMATFFVSFAIIAKGLAWIGRTSKPETDGDRFSNEP